MSQMNKRNSWKRKGGSPEKVDPELLYGVQGKGTTLYA